MNLNQRYKVSIYNYLLKKGDMVIVCNTGCGTHLKIPVECWETIEQYITAYTPAQICDAACEDDRDYYEQIFKLMIEKRLLVTDREWLNTVDLTITNRCNLQCKHCAVSAETLQGEEILSTTEWKVIIDRVLAVNPKMIVLTGGEPMVRKDFFELTEYIKNRFTGKLDLMTNSLLINRDNVDRIIRNFSHISVSIDGYNEETCAVIRGEGVFSKVINAVNLLIEHGFNNNSISLSMVETADTYEKMDEFKKLCGSLGVKCMPRLFSAVGRGEENRDELMPKQLEREDVGKWEKLLDRAEQEDMQRGSSNSRVTIQCRSCTAGKGIISIDPSGNIYPCQVLMEPEFLLGNVLACENIYDMIVENQGIRVSGRYNYEQILKGTNPKCAECDVEPFCKYCAGVECYMQGHSDIDCKGKKSFLSKIVWGMV